MRTIVRGRAPHELAALRAIEDPDHKQVRKPFDIGEPHLELRPDLENAFLSVLRAEPARNMGSLLIRTPNPPDRLHRELGPPFGFRQIGKRIRLRKSFWQVPWVRLVAQDRCLDNAASIRVMTKLGMRFERHARFYGMGRDRELVDRCLR